ncbi:replication initiator protein A [Deinococcus sp. QL22]|uniref:replication initiator protein A n=1 Tax=Deinococcus sp. QL22 TaxID=2939437 RepID=UPI002017BE15|nr:replication initiator protein A [Deinococcus sp. QL22]UQN10659.1 replication initiator protein A [Deinococcus sp. QL22]
MTIRINELDLTRAGVVSVQKTTPSGDTSWQVDYEIGDVMYRVVGSAFYGRPYGSDADVLLALQSLFFRAGCPESNRIEVLPAELLALSALPDNGQSYVRLREALLRLSGVQWSLVRSEWQSEKRRHQGETTVTGLISDLRLLDQASGEHRPFHHRELNERLPIEITFTATFAASIRAGLFQILDAELLARLGQPTARSLYRVLQAHRVQVNGGLATELTLPVRDWLMACGLEHERTDNAKRTLELAHERLLAEDYLKASVFSGRGRSGQVSYVFQCAPEPEVVEALMNRGVTRPVAEALAADHPDRVAPALRQVDERLAAGWKPRSLAASVVDAVRNPSKWGFGVGEAPSKPSKAAPKRKRTASAEEDLPGPQDARETLGVLLRLRLSRAPSAAALAALQELTAEQVSTVRAALERPAAEALPLVRILLSVEL